MIQDKMKKNLLFFYSNPHSGHRCAADALRASFRGSYSQVETFGIDAFTHGFPRLAPLLAKTYLKIIESLPQIWDFLWDNQEVEQATRLLRELLSAVTATKLENLFRYYRPAGLVCTHALPCNLIAWGKRRGMFDLPLIAVITDFAVHPYWFDEMVDLYIVPTKEVKEAMVSRETISWDESKKYRIKEKKIKVCGIPIDPRFSLKKDKYKARENFRLNPDLPVALVMGGTNGLGIEKIVSSLYESLEAQILVVAGMNRKLYQGMKKSFPENGRVHIFEYTRRIPEMMDCADLLITKPGGLTSAEALAKGLPMVIFNSLPGQEERNCQYLLAQGVARHADTPEQVVKTVKYLLSRPLILKRMNSLASHLSSPEAAAKTAQVIYRLI